MAVFTPVTLDEIIPWAAKFPIGTVRSIQCISSGIENSNFFLFTDRGEYVLTIFEKLNVHSRKEAIALIESHFI